MAKELSIFMDESGDRSGRTRYYLITLVFHDQSDGIIGDINRYKMRLTENGLPSRSEHDYQLLCTARKITALSHR